MIVAIAAKTSEFRIASVGGTNSPLVPRRREVAVPGEPVAAGHAERALDEREQRQPEQDSHHREVRR